MSQKMTLVIGGAASGKSAFAEKRIKDSGLHPNYIATARIFDTEMREKVDQHITARGAGWTTFESDLELFNPLASLGPKDAVLIDCATMWLTNHMMDGSNMPAARKRFLNDIARCTAHCVVVTNETGMGIVPENALARRFRQAQGELNQHLAAQADTVIQVIAGLPQVLKGAL